MKFRVSASAPQPLMIIPFVWVFLATVQIKIDNEEAIYPFFRIMIFALLPSALVNLAQLLGRANFTVKRCIAFCVLGYLLLYPSITIFFEITDKVERNIKDALYTLALYIIIVYLLRRYFTRPDGSLNLRSIGEFWVLFALVQSIFAIALWGGLHISIGFELEFSQMEWLGTRLHGLMGTPSHLGPMVAVACVFLIARNLSYSGLLKCLFLLVVLMMTGSRASLLGLFGAALTIFLYDATRFKVNRELLFTGILGAGLFITLSLVFPTYSAEVISLATQLEKDIRFSMWMLRFAEYKDGHLSEQLFGSGYNSVNQTFNVNVDYLRNYGALYTLIFNVAFLMACGRFFVGLRSSRGFDEKVLLMITIFTYLFMQGLSTLFNPFLHITQICATIISLAYFPRSSLSMASTASTRRSSSLSS